MRTSRVAVLVLMEFEVYFDYRCPYVYRASLLLESVRASGERDVKVDWRYFSLAQVNSKDEGWTVWGAPESELVKGRLAFKAAEAARRQDRFDDFHMALLRARHGDRIDVDDHEAVERVAEACGMDLERFRGDIADPDILRSLARDHQCAVAGYGVFGTPTFVFPGGASAYVCLSEPPSASDAVRVFDHIVSLAAGEPLILEIKRPTKPASD